MKVTIKKWNAVAAWKWDMPEDDVCGICRVAFDGTCPTCKFPGDDCSLLIGECGHSFHMHCVEQWLQQDQSQGKCPMCRQPFQAKGANSGTQGAQNTAPQTPANPQTPA